MRMGKRWRDLENRREKEKKEKRRERFVATKGGKGQRG